ncbi:hypothetical protein ABH920_003804 [Catenulispora sp. EB89]|uniref:DUF2690 domain-containing protein n=1 Tax=Catenulispora sp. EB89 TaxID=3156257 RepID=UPI003512F0B5
MSSIRTRRGAVAGTLLLLASAVPGAASAASSTAPRAGTATVHPDTGCYSTSCTNQDPVAKGCATNIQTLDTVSGGSYVVHLRYSPGCNAVWAQAVGTSDSYHAGEVLGYQTDSEAYPVVGNITGTPTPQGSYSLMVSFTYWTQACIAYNASGWETQNCTGLH